MQTPMTVEGPSPAATLTATSPAPTPAEPAERPTPPRAAAGARANGAGELWVEPWVDFSGDVEGGHHPRSPYVELFWLGVLGPSATWLIRRLAMRLEEEPEGFLVSTAEIASEIGLGSRQALQAAFDRAFERCCRFGLMQRGRHNTLFVRTLLPDLTFRMAERLPPRLRAVHDRWRRNHADRPHGADVPARARRLAMALLACGDETDSVERQLHSWHFHPAVAFDAARWAAEQHTRAQAAIDDGVAGDSDVTARD